MKSLDVKMSFPCFRLESVFFACLKRALYLKMSFIHILQIEQPKPWFVETKCFEWSRT